MPKILQVSRWKKSKLRQMFKSNNSYFRILAYNPNVMKVRSVTDANSLQEEPLSSIDETFIKTSQLEVIVTGYQHTVTFNDVAVVIEEPEPNN